MSERDDRGVATLAALLSLLRCEGLSEQARLQAAVRELARHGAAESVVVAVYRRSERCAFIEAEVGLRPGPARAAGHAVGQGLIGRVLESGQPLVQRARAAAVGPAAPWPQATRGDAVCVPVMGRGHGVVGALGWQREPPRDAWLRDDIDLLSAAAAMLSEAVTRLHLEQVARVEQAQERSPARACAAVAELVARAAKTSEMLALMQRVARAGTPVLFSGERGAGKTFAARCLHALSAPPGAPLIELRCGALSASERAQGPAGWIERACGGSLLLDEVGELPAPLQAQLSKVLRAGDAGRVPPSALPTRQHARLLSTSRRDLAPAVEDGTFRRDLYYKLHSFPIAVPALRERAADLGELVDQLLSRHAQQNERAALAFTPAAQACLAAYAWPGNVRELEQVVTRAAATTNGHVIDADALPAGLRGSGGAAAGASLEEQMARFERRLLLEALHRARGRKAVAARALQITPRALNYRMQRLGIDARKTTG